MEYSYLIVVALMLILGLGSQAIIKATFRKWSKVPSSSQLTGGQAARRMLDAHGLTHVSVLRVEGNLSDHYDPKKQVVCLSPAVFDESSVAATAVACHECGHAVQHAANYAPSTVRTAVVPAVNLASNAWVFLLILGIFLAMYQLIAAAVALYAVVIVFQLITLPVEFNASSRALAYIKTGGYLPPQESSGATSVLRAAAFTYVAAALASLLYLVYILGFARR